jgi:hypothetical protein
LGGGGGGGGWSHYPPPVRTNARAVVSLFEELQPATFKDVPATFMGLDVKSVLARMHECAAAPVAGSQVAAARAPG